MTDLNELREIFRSRMAEEDFCIGEEQVEKLFRELLNEPEPPEPEYISGRLSLNDSVKVIKQILTPERIDEIFSRDSSFFRSIKKK